MSIREWAGWKKFLINILCITITLLIVLLYLHYIEGTLNVDLMPYADLFDRLASEYDALLDKDKCFKLFETETVTVLQYKTLYWQDHEVNEDNLAGDDQPTYFVIQINNRPDNAESAASTQKTPKVTASYERVSLLSAMRGLGKFGNTTVYLAIAGDSYSIIGRFFDVHDKNMLERVYVVLSDLASCYYIQDGDAGL